MDSNTKLTHLFFSELKSYNNNNFKTLKEANLETNDPVTHKACSSVVTRYFIFAEKHPEIPESDLKLLYYQLGIDMLAKYFSEYPSSSLDNLYTFQNALLEYINSESE